MTENPNSNPLPNLGDEGSVQPEENKNTGFSESWQKLWQKLLHLGLGETSLHIITGVSIIALILIVAGVMSKYFLKNQGTAVAASIQSTPLAQNTLLPVSGASGGEALESSFGITRMAQLYTNLPSHPRDEVIQYTVQSGDTLFGIAEKYGLKPESLLWSNKYILGDNPDNLIPGLEINIPPQDGAIYKWQTGDGLNGVASFFEVTPADIINWPANKLNPATLGDLSLPNIPAGTMLFVPNGIWEYTDWLPHFTRDTPVTASSIGPGACGVITEGLEGDGTFIWPTVEKWLSGYDYTSIHHGIDIAGSLDNSVWATAAGVVVYSGWSNVGYGNLVIVDHGAGWQSVYAHLDAIEVGCGQNVYQGDVVGLLGTTGNSSGPHLHFELRKDGATVNPWDFLIR